MNSAYKSLHEEMFWRYQQVVDKVLPRIPVKNGLIEIDSLWSERSLPYDLLQEIIRENKIVLPDSAPIM
ncbi:hypothetical protein LM599_06040 [Candidatus Acetothermia bacterium]|nr:hypothetical protein [Candidatus Acetothermia bacterium]MCI2427849.1 hypothetical protein [Candidatus Acetothermia bacterium]MCI2428948.1 hypothetical protein [Candidatus Acetothermia bacterium]